MQGWTPKHASGYSIKESIYTVYPQSWSFKIKKMALSGLEQAVSEAEALLSTEALFVEQSMYQGTEEKSKALRAVRALQQKASLLESELNAARINAQTAWSAKEDLEAQLYARDSTIEALRQEKQALGDSLEAHADEVVRTKRALDSALAHNQPHIDHNNSE